MSSPTPSSATPRAAILLYLSDDDQAQALRSRLTDQGFSVLRRTSRSECELALQEQPIAFAFVEVTLADAEGLEVIRACKTLMPSMKVIVLSSNEEAQCRVDAHSLGADDYLATPVQDIDLEMRVAQLKEARLSASAFPRGMGADYEMPFRPQPDGLVDGLTGLPGAGALLEHLAREFARSRRYGHKLTVLTLGVDRLGAYNQENGQKVGDRALCLVADVLRSALRSPDIVARHSGDHFVVLATDTSQDQGMMLANRLRAALRLESRHADLPALTLSIGVASSGSEFGESDELLAAAAKALLVAKADGRDCSRFL